MQNGNTTKQIKENLDFKKMLESLIDPEKVQENLRREKIKQLLVDKKKDSGVFL